MVILFKLNTSQIYRRRKNLSKNQRCAQLYFGLSTDVENTNCATAYSMNTKGYE
jgi:hypothetical protein